MSAPTTFILIQLIDLEKSVSDGMEEIVKRKWTKEIPLLLLAWVR